MSDTSGLPMPELKLHHLGFIVADIETSMKGFVWSLGAQWDGQVFNDPKQKVLVAFLATRSGDGQIELVQPAEESSPVTRFLRERGGGLHHVCYEVSSLATAIPALRARGAMIARPPLPAVAFAGRRIAWVITAEKLLVELLEAEA